MLVQSEINHEHKITDKIGAGLKQVGDAAQQFDKQHDVSGKVASGFTSAMNGITKALSKDPKK